MLTDIIQRTPVYIGNVGLYWLYWLILLLISFIIHDLNYDKLIHIFIFDNYNVADTYI